MAKGAHAPKRPLNTRAPKRPNIHVHRNVRTSYPASLHQLYCVLLTNSLPCVCQFWSVMSCSVLVNCKQRFVLSSSVDRISLPCLCQFWSVISQCSVLVNRQQRLALSIALSTVSNCLVSGYQWYHSCAIPFFICCSCCKRVKKNYYLCSYYPQTLTHTHTHTHTHARTYARTHAARTHAPTHNLAFQTQPSFVTALTSLTNRP